MTFKEFYLLRETKGVPYEFSDEDKKEITRLYTTTDTSIPQIAKRFNVPAHVIEDRVRRWGLPYRPSKPGLPGRSRPMTEEEKEDIITLYTTTNIPTRKIGEKYKLSEMGVIRKLKSWNIPLRNPNLIKSVVTQKIPQIIADYNSGMLYKDIAKKNSVSVAFAINAIRHAKGVKKRWIPYTKDEYNTIIELGKKMDDNGEYYIYSAREIANKLKKNLANVIRIFNTVKMSDGKTLKQDRNERGVQDVTGVVFKRGTRQQAFGPLGPNDPSYHSAMGRAQPLSDIS